MSLPSPTSFDGTRPQSARALINLKMLMRLFVQLVTGSLAGGGGGQRQHCRGGGRGRRARGCLCWRSVGEWHDRHLAAPATPDWHLAAPATPNGTLRRRGATPNGTGPLITLEWHKADLPQDTVQGYRKDEG